MSNNVFHRLKKLGTRPKPETSKNDYGKSGPLSYESSSDTPYYKTNPYQQLALLDEYQSPVPTHRTSGSEVPYPFPNETPRTSAQPYQVPTHLPAPSSNHVPHMYPSVPTSNLNSGPAELDSTSIVPRTTPVTPVTTSRPDLFTRSQASLRDGVAPTTDNTSDIDSWITPALLNLGKSRSNSANPSTPLQTSASLFGGPNELQDYVAPNSARSGSSHGMGRQSFGASQLPVIPSRRPDTSASSPVVSSSSKPEKSTEYNPPSIVIIVMGLTGAGKSRFVKEATGLNVDVGHSLVSATAEITPYEVSFGNRYGFLIDTPGFDDTHRTDVEIFRDVADWLARQYASHELLTSIIYVHRITDSRVAGSALRNMTVMKKMLGVESFRNLVLVTSMWDLVEPKIGEKREQELSSEFWTDLLRAGARMRRFRGDRQSALQILSEMPTEAPVTLTIQRELVDDGLQLDRTTAGTYLEREMLRSNAAEASDFYLHAQKLNEASEKHSRAESIQSQATASNLGRNNAPLKAYWSKGSRTLNQGSVGQPEHKPDPSMYANFEWEDDFRLVSLRAGSGTNPIEISLMMADVLDPPEFVALSYVVGGEARDALINIRRENRISQLYITPTLREALQQLRLSDTDLFIWVDAISINQNDLEERARQVRMMGQIFRAAQGVCIWLGPAIDGGDEAMDFISDILDFDILEDLVKDDKHQRKWLLLAKLMSRPWFRRRWVVQEIMFARDATVHCGDRVVEWDDFRDAATLFRTKWPDIQRHMNDTALTELGDAHLLGAIALIEISQSIFRRDANGKILEKLLTTEDLLSLLPMFEVGDLLDTVYAILDMANDVQGANALSVNYEQQPAELFRDTIKLVVESSGSLDIICRPWAPESGLPTWITTISKHMYKRKANKQQYERKNGTSLVGMPGNTVYRACGVMRATFENTSFHAEGDQQVLKVTGQLIGPVAEIGDRPINGNIPQEWKSLAGWQSTDDSVPVAFWRTLVANRAFDGSPAPDWYGRACEFAFRKSTDDINVPALIRTVLSSHVQDFLKRVLDVTWKRTFVLVYDGENTHCALCPPETRLDDVVCILYGCSVPVVLRKVVSYYKLVGECFVYGIMDGEAINAEPKTVTEFEII